MDWKAFRSGFYGVLVCLLVLLFVYLLIATFDSLQRQAFSDGFSCGSNDPSVIVLNDDLCKHEREQRAANKVAF